MDKEIRGRFTESDMTAFKVFKGNDELIRSVRRFFYQEEAIHTEIYNKVLYRALVKLFLPEVSSDAPVHENPSRWIDRQYVGLLTNEVKPVVIARQDGIRFIKNGMDRIKELSEGKKGKPRELVIDLKMERDYSKVPPEEVKRMICAWQDSTAFVEERLMELKSLSEFEQKTMEQLMKEQKMNSNK